MRKQNSKKSSTSSDGSNCHYGNETKASSPLNKETKNKEYNGQSTLLNSFGSHDGYTLENNKYGSQQLYNQFQRGSTGKRSGCDNSMRSSRTSSTSSHLCDEPFPSPIMRRNLRRSLSRKEPYRKHQQEDVDDTTEDSRQSSISAEKLSSIESDRQGNNTSSIQYPIADPPKTQLNTENNLFPSINYSQSLRSLDCVTNNQKSMKQCVTNNNKGKKSHSKKKKNGQTLENNDKRLTPKITDGEESATVYKDPIIDLDLLSDGSGDESASVFPGQTRSNDAQSISSYTSCTSHVSNTSQMSVTGEKKKGISLKKIKSTIVNKFSMKNSKSSFRKSKAGSAGSRESLHKIEEELTMVKTLILSFRSKVDVIPEEVAQHIGEMKNSAKHSNFTLHSPSFLAEDICEEIIDMTASACGHKRIAFIQHMMSRFSKEFVQKVIMKNEEKYSERDECKKVFKFIFEWKTHYATHEQKQHIDKVLIKAVKKVVGNPDKSFEQRIQDIMNQYSRLQSAIVDDMFLYNLAEEIGNEILPIGLELGIPFQEIGRLQSNNPHDCLRSTFEMLLLWRQRVCGYEHQLKGKLISALHKAKRKDLADKIDKASLGI